MFDKILVEQARKAVSAEELLALAKENNIEMTAGEAEKYFSTLHPAEGELEDSELDNVSGGGCGGGSKIDEYYYKVRDYVLCEIDGEVKEGEIVWKGYVESEDAFMYTVRCGLYVNSPRYNIRLSQIIKLTQRYYEEHGCWMPVEN